MNVWAVLAWLAIYPGMRFSGIPLRVRAVTVRVFCCTHAGAERSLWPQAETAVQNHETLGARSCLCAQESGSENVSAATRALAEMGGSSLKNSSRDLYRFVRLPVASCWHQSNSKQQASPQVAASHQL